MKNSEYNKVGKKAFFYTFPVGVLGKDPLYRIVILC